MKLPSKLKQVWFPNGVLLLAPFILYAKVLLTGEVLFWGLPALQFIPWRAYAWQLQLSGFFPLWNPLNGMGAPLFANYQLAWFYPPAWISIPFQVFGGVPALAWGLTLLVPLHMSWAGLGMARLVRSLGLSELAQCLAGLAFALTGYLVARSGFFTMIWAGAWLPWILLGASSLAVPGKDEIQSSPWIKPGFILAVTMQLLSGHAQLTWYTLVLAGLWVLVGGISTHSWRFTSTIISKWSCNVMIAVAISAVQLVPTAEFLIQSQRTNAVDFDLGLTYSFWPWRLLTLLSPNFFGNPGNGNYFGYASYWEDATYIGFIPLVLAIATVPLIFGKRNGKQDAYHRGLTRFGWGVILVGFIFALGKNTPLFPYLYEHVPTFSLFNGPARWMIWPIFGLSLLAAVGADRWSRPVGKHLKRFKRLTAAAMALALGAGIAWIVFRQIQVTFIEATAATGIWAVSFCVLTLIMPINREGTPYQRWKLAVTFIVVLDLVIAGWYLIPSIPAVTFLSNQENDFAQAASRTYIRASDEYALKFRRFFRFSDYRPIEDWDELFKVELPNLNILPGSQFSSANNFDPLLPGRYARWMAWIDQLSEKDLTNALLLMNVGRWVQRDTDATNGIKINELPSLERVRWVSCMKAVSNEAEAWNTMTNWVATNQNTSVIFENISGPVNADCPGGELGQVNLIQETPLSLILQTQSAQPGGLIIADTWYPGWEAKVDGISVPLWRANYLFMGIPVDTGTHQVEIKYQPKSFMIGAGISSFGLLFMILWSMLRRHRVK